MSCTCLQDIPLDVPKKTKLPEACGALQELDPNVVSLFVLLMIASASTSLEQRYVEQTSREREQAIDMHRTNLLLGCQRRC